MSVREIKPVVFYGENTTLKVASKTFNKPETSWVKEHQKMPSHILGPPDFWKEYSKQSEAIEVANKHSNNVEQFCVFVYQQIDGYRKFVVTHPELYWWHYSKRADPQKCSYEVIIEGEPCWLYLDLEFSIELNPQSNGVRMCKTFINICCAYFLKQWGLPCSSNNILILDSTSTDKFSRHVIFCIKDVVFRNNFHVGTFVKTICADLVDYITCAESNHDVLDSFDKKDIERLFVETKNGKRLFIDTGVYTKNRHFRIYKSTKWGKESYLTVAPDCKHIPLQRDKDLELAIFLDSLISYFPNKKDLIQIEFHNEKIVYYAKPNSNTLSEWKDYNKSAITQYRELDEYILAIVSPGRIRSCKYIESTKLVIYEILGNRFCENIGRNHKSNNIYWIVDLNKKIIYQKCHDEDCMGFKSQPKKLPDEICFHLDVENDDLLFSVAEIEDTDFSNVN